MQAERLEPQLDEAQCGVGRALGSLHDGLPSGLGGAWRGVGLQVEAVVPAVQIVVHPRGGEPLADGQPRTLAVAHRPVGGGDETHQGDVAQVDAVDVRVGEQVSQGDELLIEVLVVDGDPRVGGEVEAVFHGCVLLDGSDYLIPVPMRVICVRFC